MILSLCFNGMKSDHGVTFNHLDQLLKALMVILAWQSAIVCTCISLQSHNEIEIHTGGFGVIETTHCLLYIISYSVLVQHAGLACSFFISFEQVLSSSCGLIHRSFPEHLTVKSLCVDEFLVFPLSSFCLLGWKVTDDICHILVCKCYVLFCILSLNAENVFVLLKWQAIVLGNYLTILLVLTFGD